MKITIFSVPPDIYERVKNGNITAFLIEGGIIHETIWVYKLDMPIFPLVYKPKFIKPYFPFGIPIGWANALGYTKPLDVDLLLPKGWAGKILFFQ